MTLQRNQCRPERYAQKAYDKNGLMVFSLAELDGAKTTKRRVDKPLSDHCNEAEYFCQNTDCVVREVTIRVKLHGEPRPATFLCPACGIGPLKFHNWIEQETLFLVEGEQ